jgi:hypothetical protein
MEWTLDQFYMNGGTTTFADRLAAVLGIHVSSIKVVGVYEGSLVLDYNIFQTQAGGSVTNGTFLQDIQRRQMEVIRDAGSDPNIPLDWLGAPIVDFSMPSSNMRVLSDGVLTREAFVALTGLNETEYNATNWIITKTSTNAGGTSTRLVEPDYIHVDTTVVFKPQEEVRPDYQPDSSIKIVDAYEQYLQDQEVEAKREVEREQSKSATPKTIILAAVVVVCLGAFFAFLCVIKHYASRQKIDMQAVEKIK